MTKQGKLETVSFSTEPYCRKAAEVGASAEAVAAARPNHPWLSPPALQAKLRVLEEELKPYEPSLIGVTFENEPQTAIVVLYPDFTAYEELQAKLAPRVKPLPVALRPGCHTSQQLAEALTILQGRAWHPKAGNTPTGWHLDVASSAYAVVVEDSAPEVAEALRQKLGDRVHVTLGKPRRHALDGDSAAGR
jgi:hypothetical protein